MIRLNSRPLVLSLSLTAIAIGVTLYFVSLHGPTPPAEPPAEPILQIRDRASWIAATQNSQCIVLVDGDWSIDTALFRRPFREFASWCQTERDVTVLTMVINPQKQTEDVWKICQELWNKYEIPQGGLRYAGGAGRVLWVRNGAVVDYAWCMDFMKDNKIADTYALLKKRTRRVFD